MPIQPPKRFQLTPVKWPSAKSLQTINVEMVLENSVPQGPMGKMKQPNIYVIWNPIRRGEKERSRKNI